MASIYGIQAKAIKSYREHNGSKYKDKHCANIYFGKKKVGSWAERINSVEPEMIFFDKPYSQKRLEKKIAAANHGNPLQMKSFAHGDVAKAGGYNLDCLMQDLIFLAAEEKIFKTMPEGCNVMVTYSNGYLCEHWFLPDVSEATMKSLVPEIEKAEERFKLFTGCKERFTMVYQCLGDFDIGAPIDLEEITLDHMNAMDLYDIVNDWERVNDDARFSVLPCPRCGQGYSRWHSVNYGGRVQIDSSIHRSVVICKACYAEESAGNHLPAHEWFLLKTVYGRTAETLYP